MNRWCRGVGEKRCNQTGDWTASDLWRCPTCRAEQHQKMNTGRKRAKKARLYGPHHKARRTELQTLQRHGHTLKCWRCGQTLADQWDLDHEAIRVMGREMPACIACNRGNKEVTKPGGWQ